MTPINFTGSTHTMKGPPGSGIGDLPVASVPPYIISLWTFTPEERAAIAAGKNLMLSIMAHGMPPVALAIAPDCCAHCGHEVKPGTDIGLAALECDLSAAMRENPEGVFDRTADAKAHDEAASRDDRAAIDAIGRALFAAPDHCWNFDPAGILEVAHLLLKRNPLLVRAIADEVISKRGGVERP